MVILRKNSPKVNGALDLGSVGPRRAGHGRAPEASYCHRRQCHIENAKECIGCFKSSDELQETFYYWRSCVDLNISTHPADLPPTLQPHAIVGAAIERAELIGSVHPVRRLLEAHAEPYLTSLVIRSLLNAGHREWALELCQLRELDLHKLLDTQNRAYWATHGEEEGQARCMTVTFAGRGEVEVFVRYRICGPADHHADHGGPWYEIEEVCDDRTCEPLELSDDELRQIEELLLEG